MERTTHKNKPRILCCDPSFTAWGVAVLENHTVIAVGCLKTAPEAKKRRIRQGDDLVRRTSELIAELIKIISKWHVEFIVAELPHGSQNARGAVMIGIVTGILQTLSMSNNIPIEWYSEGDAKKALLGRISASKAEVIQAVEGTFDTVITGPKYAREAIADALAIYNVAHRDSPTLKILTR